MRLFISLLLAVCSLGAYAEQAGVADPVAVKAQLANYYFDAARRGDIEILDTFIEAGYALDTRDDLCQHGHVTVAGWNHLTIEHIYDSREGVRHRRGGPARESAPDIRPSATCASMERAAVRICGGDDGNRTRAVCLGS